VVVRNMAGILSVFLVVVRYLSRDKSATLVVRQYYSY